jgi:hypothetical protein
MIISTCLSKQRQKEYVAELCTNEDIGKQKEAQLNDVFFLLQVMEKHNQYKRFREEVEAFRKVTFLPCSVQFPLRNFCLVLSGIFSLTI